MVHEKSAWFFWGQYLMILAQKRKIVTFQVPVDRAPIQVEISARKRVQTSMFDVNRKSKNKVFCRQTSNLYFGDVFVNALSVRNTEIPSKLVFQKSVFFVECHNRLKMSFWNSWFQNHHQLIFNVSILNFRSFNVQSWGTLISKCTLLQDQIHWNLRKLLSLFLNDNAPIRFLNSG